MAIPGHLLALGQSVIEVRVMSEVKLVDDAHLLLLHLTRQSLSLLH